MNMKRRGYSMGLIAGLAIFRIGSGFADVPEYFGSEIVIEEPTATPSHVGGKSELRFRIVNDSRHNLNLSSVETPAAEQAKLIADAGSGRTVVLDSVSIPAGEEVDLTTNHLRYEIFPLRRPLAVGDEFPATLNFGEFGVSVVFHVHQARRN